MNIPKLVIAAGILLSSVILIDALLPKQKLTSEVWSMEAVRTYYKGTKTLSRFDIVLNNGIRFPISKNDPDDFKNGEPVEVGISRIFKKPSYLKNLATGRSRTPAEGMFSYFILAPIALAISSGLGVYFKNQPKAFNNCCALTLFLLIGTIVVVAVV